MTEPEIVTEYQPEPGVLLTTIELRKQVEHLRSLRGQALVLHLMRSYWYAMPNDLIGGWCIVPIRLPPSSGVIEIADFLDEQFARHIAALHNAWWRNQQDPLHLIPLEGDVP